MLKKIANAKLVLIIIGLFTPLKNPLKCVHLKFTLQTLPEPIQLKTINLLLTMIKKTSNFFGSLGQNVMQSYCNVCV